VGATLPGTNVTRHNGTATPDINITPLVDVVLVLLIIFMVIAPALNEGAQIELPKVLTPDPKPRDISPITVLILDDGSSLVNEKPVDAANLAAILSELHKQEPNRALLFKSDKNTKYQRVRETFAMVQGLGFKGVLLKVTEKKPAGMLASGSARD
jgi:biopolymer transport protein ExbD/biopolymer transport protein TolR